LRGSPPREVFMNAVTSSVSHALSHFLWRVEQVSDRTG
jgi:hypothetical protein